MTWNIVFWILASYVVLSTLAYFIQDFFIFKPEKLSADFEFKYDYPFEELNFTVSDKVTINGLRFFSEEKEKNGLVIYFHGNTRSIKGWAKYSRDFTVHGYDVLMIDYRGFGKSRGKRSEKAMKEDAQHVYNRLRYDFGILESDIVIYGRSLGSGFAAKLASSNKPKMLILDAPYYSFSNLTSRFLPFLPLSIILRFKIRTDEWLKYCRCPIYIIHGTKDLLIPLRSSVRLSKVAPLNTHLAPIYGGGHNNLPSFPEYHRVLRDILLGQYDEFDKQILGDIGFNT
ncbi:alpha/beta hydrolase [uncultured Arcticibacterium sp.]|uniref:alpha/beta hydrolase n=1 Tax=uncultured Arcticibacterium sp. TaxID=2173042 RepID=UPI0030F92FE5